MKNTHAPNWISLSYLTDIASEEATFTTEQLADFFEQRGVEIVRSAEGGAPFIDEVKLMQLFWPLCSLFIDGAILGVIGASVDEGVLMLEVTDEQANRLFDA